MNEPLFSMGRIVATPGALAALEKTETNPDHYLARHHAGDWGDLCSEDVKENEFSLKNGFRLFSAYELPTGAKVRIITEHDRSVTTILLPEEY